MSDVGADDTAMQARLAGIEAELSPALSAEVASLGAALKARIEAKLSGEVLATKSGALLASLVLEDASKFENYVMRVASRDVPYARVQEFGGKTAAHEIVAIKAKALAVVSGGRTFFAKSVHHPGSMIPQRSFMRSALDEMREEIVGGLKSSIAELIRQT